jgi:hypothetical protein
MVDIHDPDIITDETIISDPGIMGASGSNVVSQTIFYDSGSSITSKNKVTGRMISDALLPEGAVWNPVHGLGFDCLIDGMADINMTVIDYISALGFIRNPMLTSILSDLETEFGLMPNASLTEQQRRIRLQAVMADKTNDGSAPTLKSRLIANGFNVQVVENSPAVDPSLYTLREWSMVCGNSEAVCGYDTAICGLARDALVVNGNFYIQNDELPSDEGYWPLIFFICGGVVTSDGHITDIIPASVPGSRADELVRLIVKYKPLHTWAVIVAEFTS